MKRDVYLDSVRKPKVSRSYDPATKEASLGYWHAAQELTQKTADRKWRPWSSTEEALILASADTDVVLAQRLRRSMAAVRTKRKKLYRRAASAQALDGEAGEPT